MTKCLLLVLSQIATCLLIITAMAVTDLRLLADDWPQWRGVGSRGVWPEQGMVSKFEAQQLPIKWCVPIGAGYSGPTVARGRVYVTDRILRPQQSERVHCFDAEKRSIALELHLSVCAT